MYIRDPKPVVEPGEFQILIGASVQNIRSKGTLYIEGRSSRARHRTSVRSLR